MLFGLAPMSSMPKGMTYIVQRKDRFDSEPHIKLRHGTPAHNNPGQLYLPAPATH